MTGYPDLYLMRHGETEWNAAGRMQGRLDSGLTARGRAQAARQARLIADLVAGGGRPSGGHGWARYASPQGRARQTAALIFDDPVFNGVAFGDATESATKRVIFDPRLVEIDIGTFSGHLLADLRARHPECFTGGRFDWYDRAPGGEGFAGLETRARAFLDDLTGPALVVTHGITLRMLARIWLGLPQSQFAALITPAQGEVLALTARDRAGAGRILR